MVAEDQPPYDNTIHKCPSIAFLENGTFPSVGRYYGVKHPSNQNRYHDQRDVITYS